MLSLQDLKFHCRICLKKLCPDLEGTEHSIGFIAITEFSEVHELIQVCLRSGCSENNKPAEVLNKTMPNICINCFRKWMDFATCHYQVLKENTEELKIILNNGLKDNSKFSDKMENMNKNVNDENMWEIENYDTMSPFYHEDECSTALTPEETTNIEEFKKCNQDDCRTAINDGEIVKDDLLKACEYSTSVENPESKRRIISEECRNTPLPTNSSEDPENDLSNSENITYHNDDIFNDGSSKRDSIKKNNSRKNYNRKGNKTSTKREIYRCEPCKKYFYGIHKYEGHRKEIHEGISKAYQCNYCEKAYRFYKNLREHIATNHSSIEPSQKYLEKEIFKCEVCSGVFKTQQTLKTHQKIKHQNLSKSCICEQCGFLSHSQYGLENHIKNRHSVAEQIKCPKCPKIFKNRYYLKYHTMNVHNDDNDKPFKCTDCDMAFTRQALLNVHKRSHLKLSERIKCDFEGCEVRFLFNGEKIRHIKMVHLKIKKYVCDICGEAFATGQTLKHHRYIHLELKPFICTLCGQGFRQRSAMRTHQKTHKPHDDSPPNVIDNKSEVRYTLNLENF
ncbi:uncharacterized protein LOC142228672 [Haematobia irritans]|uniref:uncharacterized protein LOC142228672 n=1 Tax=Haematobia irritans TaxID=7368 RepID=UPI003F4FCC91